ncbi:hypothetical protein MWU75_04900 [Ornithinimicrobium sp. F0845]|uniref:hypothetical protein n=1 Tax=Ornithinimicrobium sp. F0845 TaxID=2926412 RepID=UPI001FF68080|nr:hypothetical protein [Ornithinimicrobium sp. F0845]MCK0111474.1 hypothetical protein [Ornithinimicrobium sp. F0845]
MAAFDRSTVRPLLAGVLTANSLGHLATAAAGKEHLTPLAGRHSGPIVNAVWGGANLLGGLVLARAAASPGRRWGREINAFAAGATGFAAWMFLSELAWPVNTGEQAAAVTIDPE